MHVKQQRVQVRIQRGVTRCKVAIRDQAVHYRVRFRHVIHRQVSMRLLMKQKNVTRKTRKRLAVKRARKRKSNLRDVISVSWAGNRIRQMRKPRIANAAPKAARKIRLRRSIALPV